MNGSSQQRCSANYLFCR